MFLRSLLLILIFPTAALACADDPDLLFISCATPAQGRLIDVGPGIVPAPPPNSLTVTGTYSSGDRFGIEGLAIVEGQVLSARFQRWDGLMVIDTGGVLSIFHVERVRQGGTMFNLRNPDERAAFLTYAADNRLSVLQSHLLIVDGQVDVRDQPDQPRFQRRVLFTDANGAFGVFDTGNERLTLFDTATQMAARFSPRMAFNLDMGAYDLCLRVAEAAEVVENCGRLGIDGTEALTNVLEFTFVTSD